MMKVLMLGWEFPPYISGGLGTACYGLTRALTDLGAEILFVLPQVPQMAARSHVRFLIQPRRRMGRGRRRRPTWRMANVNFPDTPNPILWGTYGHAGPPLGDAKTRGQVFETAAEGTAAERAVAAAQFTALFGTGSIYSGDVLAKTRHYADLVCELADGEDFDVIHAHDWMTFPAGAAVARASGRPWIAHVHATEFDRTGTSPFAPVYEIERAGTTAAQGVIAVSELTKATLVRHYGLPPHKVRVVHNAVLSDHLYPRTRQPRALGRHAHRPDDKIVLFLGRVTMQKGPEYFLLTARRLIDTHPHVRFVVAGDGDRLPGMIELSAELGLAGRMLFSGFLRGAQVERAYRMADVYVMPSVSEPFGITPLESMLRGVPALISRQSGVAEVVRHALVTDYWDTEAAADKLSALLTDTVLYEHLSAAGLAEARTFHWSVPARKCLRVYQSVTGLSHGWGAAPPLFPSTSPGLPPAP